MQTLQTYTRHIGYADCWPLVRRMIGLHLDPDDIADDDPVLYCGLRSACMTCKCRGTCIHDLADETADPAWQDWRDYCPNATTLSVLSAVKGCHAH